MYFFGSCFSYKKKFICPVVKMYFTSKNYDLYTEVKAIILGNVALDFLFYILKQI